MSKLHETLHGGMLSILRRGGVTMTFEQMEAVKGDCDRLADAILETVKAEAVEPAKRLQKATLEAFEKMSDDIDKIEGRVEVLEGRRRI